MPRARSTFAYDLAATLVGRYGSKALEAVLYVVAMRTVGADAVGVVFVAQAASALAFRVLDLGLYTVVVRSSARRQLDLATYEGLVSKRFVGICAMTLAFAVYAQRTTPDALGLLVGFFAASGLVTLHELPRGVLAGHERFDALAKLNLVSKAFETVCATAGMLLGAGLVTWLVARLVAHVAFTFVAARLAREILGDAHAERAPPLDTWQLVRTGLVFWLTRLFDVAGARVAILIVTMHAGLAGAAKVGLASKLNLAVVTLFGTVAHVAFPRVTRAARRDFPKRGIAMLAGVALALGAAVFLGAPLYVRVMTGAYDSAMIALVRVMAVVLALSALSRPLEMWLEAKDHERFVLGVAAVAFLVHAPAAWLLVDGLGIVGAGWARVAQGAFEALATTAIVLFVAARHAPPPAELETR